MFCSNSANVYSGVGEIIQLVGNKDDGSGLIPPLLISLTSNSVSLWLIKVPSTLLNNQKPMMLLSTVTRSEQTLKEDGLNLHLTLHPNSTQCAILTTKGFIHFYDLVDSLISHSVNIELRKCVGDTGVPSLLLKFRIGLEVDSGVSMFVDFNWSYQRICGSERGVTVSIKDEVSFLDLNWEGECIDNSAVPHSTLSFVKPVESKYQ